MAGMFAKGGPRRSSILAELIVAAGEEAAQKLVAAFGGARLYVPQTPAPGDPLSQVIGREAAVRLARVYGGDRVDIPNPNLRRARIAELRRAGRGVDAIARELGCTRRRVFQVLAEERAEARAALAAGECAGAGARDFPERCGAASGPLVNRRTAERFHP